MIARGLFYALCVYLFLVAFMYVMQRQLQYYPDKSHPGTPSQYQIPKMKDIIVETIDGLKLLAWFAPPEKKDGKILVFFHGNAGHIGDRAVKATHFIEQGYGVFFCEYRGYGGNPGKPTEEGFYKDARASLLWLEDQGYRPGQFVLYGESIGSGPAVQMAVEIKPAAMILEAPFTSAADVAKRVYPWLPVDILMKDRFDNIDKIKDVEASLLFIHGDEDSTVSIASGKALYEAANHPKEFAAIYGAGHNNLYDHHAGHIISDWLKEQ